MKQTMMLRNLYMGTRNLLLLHDPRRTLTLNNGNTSVVPLFRVPLMGLRFFNSENDPPLENPNHTDINSARSHNADIPTTVADDVSKKDLKMQIEKYLGGDEEAIPLIFESILKRKLAGKHDESDDEVMDTFRSMPLDISELDSDSDSDYMGENK